MKLGQKLKDTVLGTMPAGLRSGIKNAVRPLLPRSLRRMVRHVLPGNVPAAPADPPHEPLNWTRLLERDADLWQAARLRAENGPPVLMATNLGGFLAGSYIESLLSIALTLRGARVKVLLCDRVLPACHNASIGIGPSPEQLGRYEIKQVLCDSCCQAGSNLFGPLGIDTIHYSKLLGASARDECRRLAETVPPAEIGKYEWNGMAVGEHALAGALRFFARGEIGAEPGGHDVLRRYFEASLLTARTVSELIGRERFEVACFNHGIYVPQGLTAEACRHHGLRLVTWNVAYRKQCFIFSHDDTYHHTMLEEPASAWDELPWTAEREQTTMEYLSSRLTGSKDWIWFHEQPTEDVEKIARECGVDFSRPVIGLLTNVFWDAQLHYRTNAFTNMLDWVVRTIEYFRERPDLQLLIRIHPAEVRGNIPSRQPILAEIHKAFPELPANVFIIPPESNSSTYAAMYRCDSVIIYGTKTGVELTSVGIPVIVAGEAWIRGKGLTRDADSPAEYFGILDELPSGRRLDEATRARARKYAYHFFFRRMIPLPFVHPGSPFNLTVSSLEELMPGRCPGLDVICAGILAGKPFIYPAEELGVD